MNKTGNYCNIITIGLATILLAALTGCVGYADAGYGGGVVATGPDVSIYGGFYDRGVDVHAYHDRGFRSRGIAHSGGWGRDRNR
jgi:hypothetical protein